MKILEEGCVYVGAWGSEDSITKSSNAEVSNFLKSYLSFPIRLSL